MNYTLGMRRLQRAANLLNDLDCLSGRKFIVAPEESTQVLSVHIFHGDELETIGIAQIIDPNHVLVCDVACQNQFLLETLQNTWIAR